MKRKILLPAERFCQGQVAPGRLAGYNTGKEKEVAAMTQQNRQAEQAETLRQMGARIAARRKALGLTQKQLAEQLLVSDKTVSKWELGGSLR